MERPSSRAGMHPEKERRNQMNGGSTSKHKSKSSPKSPLGNWFNNNKPPYADRSFNYSDSYMGPGYSSMMGLAPDPLPRGLAQSYMYQSSPLYEPSFHHPGLSAEPSSLPMFPHAPWSTPSRQRPRMPAPAWDVWSSAYAPATQHRNFGRNPALNTDLWPQEEEDFASLPPVFNDIKSAPTPARSNQRRFSDPGVVVPEPEGSGDGSSSSPEEEEGDVAAQSGLVQRLLLEMSALRETNQRLFRELDETRSQLEAARTQQASGWRRLGPEYQPGMLADMVREVREASRIREEAMMSRLRLATAGLADQADGLRSPLGSQAFIPKRASLEMAELRGQLQRAVSERRRAEPPRLQQQQQVARTEERRRKRRQDNSRGSLPGSGRGDADSSLDDEESSLSGGVASPAGLAGTSGRGLQSPGVASPAGGPSLGVLADQVQQLRREKQQLSGELRQAVDSRTETEAHVQKLERLVGILRKKITAMNGLEQTLAEVSGPTSLVSVPESLSSHSSSAESSLEPTTVAPAAIRPQVTIHGPVTNL